MDLKLEFTNKEITPWGGMALMKRMLDGIGFREVLEGCAALPQPGSNRGYKPADIIESFIVSVWCGANRFLHTEVTRHDPALGRIFGWKRVPGNDTYKRFFSKFSQARNHEMSDHLYRWFFSELKFDNFTLDLDSTVLTRYGSQEGARRGYNPTKPGRASHHPLLAFVSDCRMVANCWLRPGNAHAAGNFVSFLEDTLAKLQGKTVGLLRLDSGFHDKKVFDYLEKKKPEIPYIVSARFYEPIQHILAGQRTWMRLADGVEVSETRYKGVEWDKPRRVVLVRQHVPTRAKATGKTLSLFEDQPVVNQYRYSCYVTNLSLPPAEVWRLYRGRADAENRIKELKYDFGFDSFNLRQFWGTEAAMLVAMMGYNLMSLFRQFIFDGRVQHTLSTLRFRVFAIGAYLVKDGRHVVLKLSLALKRREWFTGLWDESQRFQLPVEFSNA